MDYQPINVKRGGVSSSDIEIKLEPQKEPEEGPTKTVKVEQQEEKTVVAPVEVDLTPKDENEEEEVTTTKAPAKKAPGRPKGSKNKKRDKRIQQLLEQRDEEAKKAAEMEAKLAAIEKQMFESTKASTKSRKSTLEDSLESLQAQLKSAYDDDDTDAIVKIQDKMLKANMEYAAVNYELENTPEEYPTKKATQEAPKASPYALSWIDDHPEFNKDVEFNAAALGANAKLIKEGFDPEGPEFYEELDKRLSKRYPEYFEGYSDTSDSDVVEYSKDDPSEDDDDSDYPQTVAGASRTPSGSTPGSKASGRKRKNTVILTQEDQILCNKWGIDPVDFAKRKKSLEGKDKGDYTNI